MTRQEILAVLDDYRDRPAYDFYTDDSEICGLLMEIQHVKSKIDGEYISCKLRLGSIGGHGLYLSTSRAVLYTFDEEKREVEVSMDRDKCDDIDDAIATIFYANQLRRNRNA